MSYKRRRTDTLTGGTKDVNPQFMTLQVTQTAADTFTERQFQVPIQRLQNQSGRAQVMEVLKAYFVSSPLSGEAAAATTHQVITSITTKSMAAAPTFAEPTLIAYYEKANRNAFTAAGSAQLNNEVEPFIFDSSDNMGHGILVASDSIFVQQVSIATGVATTGLVKLLYRWKDVSIAEYVGIVQSQTS